MKIAVVTPYFRTPSSPKGGVGSHYAELVEAMAPLVEQITVVVPHASFPSHLSTSHLPENVRLIRLRCGNGEGPFRKILGRFFNLIFNLRVAWTLTALQRAGRLDLVETTNYQYPCLVYSFCPGHAPIITRVSTTTRQIRESNDDTRKRGLGLISRLERTMIRRSSGLVTHTNRHAEITAVELGFPASRFHIIPHGIFIPPTVPPLPSMDSPSVLFVGSLDRRKGADVLIESIPELLQRFDNLTFRIVGFDSDNTYQKLLAAHPSVCAHNSVIFLGVISQDALEEEYRKCHLVVCPSRYESFGLVFAEAMSFGRVPVGTTAGGIPEVVDHGITGILVEPGSVPSLIHGLDQLLSESAAIRRFSSSAREAAEKRFDRILMAGRTVAFYSKFVRPPSPQTHAIVPPP